MNSASCPQKLKRMKKKKKRRETTETPEMQTRVEIISTQTQFASVSRFL